MPRGRKKIDWSERCAAAILDGNIPLADFCFRKLYGVKISFTTKDISLMEAEVIPEPSIVINYKGFGHIPCSHFGCARTLSLIESLAGKYCTKHMNHLKTDPVRVVKL